MLHHWPPQPLTSTVLPPGIVVMTGKFVPGPCRKLTLLVASAGTACAPCTDSANTAVAPAASCAILIAALPRCTCARRLLRAG
jgi:hypothetical protein